ncbi:MAG TPA: hypothetical protein VGJ20_00100 [Xanthobacteraceae bacterium]|jgi:hypothetical protein
MPKFWKIVVTTKRTGAEKLPPVKEFYIAAIGNTRQQAQKALEDVEALDDAEVELIELPAKYFNDLQPGKIFRMVAVS